MERATPCGLVNRFVSYNIKLKTLFQLFEVLRLQDVLKHVAEINQWSVRE